jgi:hypothetical protein
MASNKNQKQASDDEKETSSANNKSGSDKELTSGKAEDRVNNSGNTSAEDSDLKNAEHEQHEKEWDTLNNDQANQMSSGSYSPRFQGKNGNFDHNNRQSRSQGERDQRNDHDRQRQNDEYQRQKQSSEKEYFDNRYNRQGSGGYKGSDYGKGLTGRSENNHGTQQFDDTERYASHWHTGHQLWPRNNEGYYSDYENPPFDYEENPSRYLSDDREDFRTPQYNDKWSGRNEDLDGRNDRQRRSAGEWRDTPPAERSRGRGYQYGNDLYNSGMRRGYENYSPEEYRRMRGESDVYDSGSRGSHDYDSARYRGDNDDYRRYDDRYRSRDEPGYRGDDNYGQSYYRDREREYRYHQPRDDGDRRYEDDYRRQRESRAYHGRRRRRDW